MHKTTYNLQWFSTNTFYLYAAIAIVGLAIYLRLIGLDRGIWLDEYVTIAHINKGGLISVVRAAMSDNQLPAFYLLLKVWSFFDESVSFLRLLPAICSVITVAVLIVWLNRYSYLTGLLAGFLFAASPNMLRYSQELRTYGLLMLAMTVSLYCVSRIIEHPAKIWGYLGLTLSLTMAASAHLIGSMMFFTVLGYFLLVGNLKKVSITRLVAAFALPSIIFLTLYLVMFLKLKETTDNWWMPAPSVDLISDIAGYAIGAPTAARFMTDVRDAAPSLAFPIQLCLAITGLAAIVLGRWRRSLPFLIGAVLFWLPLLGYSLLAKPVFYYRTILPGLIPLLAFFAVHLATIQPLKIKMAVISVVVALHVLFIAEWVTNVARRPVEPWQQGAQVLEANWQPGDIVVYYPNYVRGPIEYYWPDAPAQNQFEIKYSKDIEQFQTEISRIPVGQGADSHHNIFLMIRWDSVVKKDVATHRQLLSVIRSNAGPYVKLYIVFITNSDPLHGSQQVAQTQAELSAQLAQLESLFGPPLAISTNKPLVSSTYYLTGFRQDN